MQYLEGIVMVIITASVTYFFTRKKQQAEVEKIEAETTKIEIDAAAATSQLWQEIIAQMRIEVNSLKQVVSELKQENLKLKSEISQLKLENEKLKLRFELSQNKA